jgi:hypothetical protein
MSKSLGLIALVPEMVFSVKDFKIKISRFAPGLLVVLPFAVSIVVFIVARVTAEILAPLFVGHIVIMDNHRGSKWS